MRKRRTRQIMSLCCTIATVAFLTVPPGARSRLFAAQVYQPGKGWQETETTKGPRPDLLTDIGQYRQAATLWQAGKLKRCRDLCLRIIKRYNSGGAVEQSYVLLVKTRSALNELKAAERNVAAFRKKFPKSRFSSLMADAEMDILERRARRGNRKTLRRLENLVESNPYGPRTDRAQLLVGHIHISRREYAEARDAYEVMLRAYPASRYQLEAEFGKGKATYLANTGIMRDAGLYAEAAEILKGVLEVDPDFAGRAEVERYLKEIHDRLAERQFRVARYYERQHRVASAVVYYRDVTRRFKDTRWAAKAQKQLKKLKSSSARPHRASSVSKSSANRTAEQTKEADVDKAP